MRIEREHRFDVPLAAGFEYVTNTANWPSFWPGIVRVEPGSRWAEAGDEARIVIELLRRPVELRMTLRRFEPRRLVEYDGSGFRYRLVVEYEPRPGLKGLYDRVLVRRGVDGALRRTIANLEQALPR
jgi:hypothetical protein